MDPRLYQPMFLLVTGFISAVFVTKYGLSPDFRNQIRRNSIVLPLMLTLIFIFWIGGRPVSIFFGDTINYANSYTILDPSGLVRMDWSSEWLWLLLMVVCKGSGMSVHGFFTIVEAGYMFSVLWAVKRFMPSKPLLGMMFVWTSLMFFSFGTNGLRNGLACHIMLLAMSYFFDDKYVVSALLCLTAFGFHRSVVLPIAAMLAGRYVIKSVKTSILFWIGSILVSLVSGNAIINFFSSLGFDDRMSGYNTTEYAIQFRSTGFRWDFLLYSSMPVLMGWYVCVKRRIKDDWYRTLCITYCLCNAFWVMVIRAAFSNRFAYLSWFMYPIMIAYPLVNLPVWRDQDKQTAVILLAYCGFTMFMQLCYWG